MRRFAILFFVAIALLGQPSDYMTVWADDSSIVAMVDPRNGLFSIGTGDGIPITRGFDVPWPPETAAPRDYQACFRANIAGDYYTSSPIYPDDLEFPPDSTYYDSLGVLCTGWSIPCIGGFIHIRQKLRPTYVERFPVIEITYEIGNNGALPSSAGVSFIYGNAGTAVAVGGYEPVGRSFDSGDLFPDMVSHHSSLGWPEDTMIWMTDISRDYPDHMRVGEYSDYSVCESPLFYAPSYGGCPGEVYEHPGHSLIWDRVYLPSGEVARHVTYVGIYSRTVHTVTSLEVSAVSETDSIIDCETDTSGVIRLSVINTGDTSIENLVYRADYPRTLHPVGASGDTLTTAFDPDDSLEIEFNFTFDDSLFLHGPMDITVPVVVYDGYSSFDTIHADVVVHIPYFDGFPAFVESEIIGDTLYFHVESPDADIAVSDIQLHIESTYIRLEDSVFTYIDGDIVLPLQSEYRTASGEILSFFGETEICVNVPDVYDCHALVCTLVTLGDYDFPVSPRWNLFSIPTVDTVEIMPMFTSCVPPAYTFEPDSDYYPIIESVGGMGFWITGSIDTSIYYGDIAMADSVLWNLRRGWNMVGPPATAINPDEIDLGPGADNIFWGFDPETFGYFATTLLIPGRGYFVFAPGDTSFWVR